MNVTVKELIEKLQQYPMESFLEFRSVGAADKTILVAEGHELDPVFQFHSSQVAHGFSSVKR